MPSNTDSDLVWLITGCSTGLGRALAARVLEQGYRAAITARNAQQVEDIASAYPGAARPVALDVADPGQVERAIAQAEQAFGRVDVLVNNAGYGYLAAVEEGEETEVRAMFETNFFGLVALTKRVLPGMRARGYGHIVNVSSVGGLIGNPGSGYYNATKFAVEGLSEALSKEVQPLGIRVTVIEPGPFRTDWAGRSLKQTRVALAAYAQTAGARRAEIAGRSGRQPGDPARAADAIITAVRSDSPPLNLVLGKDGLMRVRAKVGNFASALNTWEAVSLSADYPST